MRSRDPKTQNPGTQQTRPRTQGSRTQESRTQDSESWTQDFKTHNPRSRTWDPWANTDYLILIVICFWGEKTVVIDDNFPQCVLRIMMQENVNTET